MVSEAALLVQQQLDAYNARDLGAYMRCWSDDCAYWEVPDQALPDDAAALRARQAARFLEPDLHNRLRRRVELPAADPALVIDHETMTRTYPDGRGAVEVFAIYEMARGRIARAWLCLGTPQLAG
ncbi:nuclear transport factor 2 family protein [Roseomonas sp. 18066]|uniref:nuclear transport factor 2 family protein n=1 Tax=Roseomonas sp. 18066 TaxID=2681412 RepID=UPI00135B14E0|nr:nuclear transport factor 2 family protein [Roseomonas sp. 18066]